MADLVDEAQAIEERALAMGLAQARARAPSGEAARSCADCGEPIAAARRAAVPGAQRCAQCAAAAERTAGPRGGAGARRCS